MLSADHPAPHAQERNVSFCDSRSDAWFGILVGEIASRRSLTQADERTIERGSK
ncbi:MAG: hypothetical protein R3C99_05315 [Pirellulaceae bacterium]